MYLFIFVIEQYLFKLKKFLILIIKFGPKQNLLRHLQKVDVQRLISPKATITALENSRRLIALRLILIALSLATVMTILGYPYFQDQITVTSNKNKYFYIPNLSYHYSVNSLHNYELYSNSKLNLSFQKRPQPFEKDLKLTLPATFDPQKLAKSHSKLEYIANPTDFSSFIEGNFLPKLRPENIVYAKENIKHLPENYIYCGNFSFEILAKSLKNKLPKNIHEKTHIFPYKDEFYLKIGPFYKHNEAKILASNLNLNPYTPSCLIANY